MTKRRQGLLITFEGIDGCGKSTHLRLARTFLKRHGCHVSVVREPGSTPVAEKIRELLLDRRLRMTDVTELLLYEAARADLTAARIGPLLIQGRVVLCDRFYDSTTAYQGYGRRLDISTVRRLNSLAVGPIKPDLTILLDLDPKTALHRLGQKLDRLESESQTFFRRVRSGFLQIARREPSRVKVVDAHGPVEEVFDHVARHLFRLLKQP